MISFLPCETFLPKVFLIFLSFLKAVFVGKKNGSQYLLSVYESEPNFHTADIKTQCASQLVNYRINKHLALLVYNRTLSF